MQRPAEIYQKRTRLLRIAAAGLGGAAVLTWLGHDKFMAFSLESAINALGIAFTGFGGIAALAELLSDMSRREPRLVVFDDHIEVSCWLSKHPQMLYFCDVKDMTVDGDVAKKACFTLQPFLKKSDLPRTTKLSKLVFNADYTINLYKLDMDDDEAYQLILDRFLRYREKQGDKN